MTPGRFVRLAALAAAAYAVGSIQVPRLVQRLISDEPPRDHFTLEWGDGNVMRFNAAGATTVEVTAGPALGIATSLLDMSKAIIPVLALRRRFPGQQLDVLWASACVIGQMLPPQHRFAGGRGSAIVIATCTLYDPLAIPFSILMSQLVGIYALRNPILGAHAWTAVLPIYFALRRRPELVASMLAFNAVRISSSIPEMRQIRHFKRAGAFETREFHEAFEGNHVGYIHKWLRERGLVRYAYMDEEAGDPAITAERAAPAVA